MAGGSKRRREMAMRNGLTGMLTIMLVSMVMV